MAQHQAVVKTLCLFHFIDRTGGSGVEVTRQAEQYPTQPPLNEDGLSSRMHR